jgi:hypothetical protein
VSGAVLDAGALIAFDKGSRPVVAMVARALELGLRLTVPAGVVGQAWRNGRKQARLAQLLGSALVEVLPLSDAQARAAGQLCGVTKTRDVIDASVVLCARERGVCVVTSDVSDLARLAPELELVRV